MTLLLNYLMFFMIIVGAGLVYFTYGKSGMKKSLIMAVTWVVVMFMTNAAVTSYVTKGGSEHTVPITIEIGVDEVPEIKSEWKKIEVLTEEDDKHFNENVNTFESDVEKILNN